MRARAFLTLMTTAVTLAAAAPLVAWGFSDMAKMTPLMLGGLIIGGNAFYAVFVGTANGTRLFYKQAGLDITFSRTSETCTVTGSTVRFTHAGPCVVTASQAEELKAIKFHTVESIATAAISPVPSTSSAS